MWHIEALKTNRKWFVFFLTLMGMMVGDGANNEVINGIFNQDVAPTNEITMAAIPIGTGNNWRRAFNIPLEYEEVAKIIKAGHIYVHDIGKLTYYDNEDTKTRYFLYVSGTGLDEMVCHSTSHMKQIGKGGTIRYLIGIVNAYGPIKQLIFS